MMHLGLTEEWSPSRLSSFKIGEPGIQRVIYMDYFFLKLDQVGIFVW